MKSLSKHINILVICAFLSLVLLVAVHFLEPKTASNSETIVRSQETTSGQGLKLYRGGGFGFPFNYTEHHVYGTFHEDGSVYIESSKAGQGNSIFILYNFLIYVVFFEFIGYIFLIFKHVGRKARITKEPANR